MKKIICLVTALTITAASCVTMAAAKDNEEQVNDAEIMVIAPAPEDIMVISPAPSEAEEILGTPQITVDGEKVDLSKTKLSHYMYTENENTLVPLRAVAEKMGYDVDWNNEEKYVSVNNDEWEVVLNIGEDSYFGVTKIKDAVGMTAPQSYGVAPKIIEDTTFVPAKMFELMGYKFEAVGQYASFTKAGAADDKNTQIPKPFVSYNTLNEAKKTVDFDAKALIESPEGYEVADISVMSGKMLQIVYESGEKKITYRTMKGTEDISGDHNVYKNEKTVDVSGIKVTLKGNEKTDCAIWSDDGASYALDCDGEIDEMQIVKIIKTIE